MPTSIDTKKPQSAVINATTSRGNTKTQIWQCSNIWPSPGNALPAGQARHLPSSTNSYIEFLQLLHCPCCVSLGSPGAEVKVPSLTPYANVGPLNIDRTRLNSLTPQPRQVILILDTCTLPISAVVRTETSVRSINSSFSHLHVVSSSARNSPEFLNSKSVLSLPDNQLDPVMSKLQFRMSTAPLDSELNVEPSLAKLPEKLLLSHTNSASPPSMQPKQMPPPI
mmetsp:Transcript_6413/g.19793  ORF Transcript_6413/g.19793 Transcript_6413/m.19793 type:complete len:224 (-) Transcript_6413:1336-2007(-)